MQSVPTQRIPRTRVRRSARRGLALLAALGLSSHAAAQEPRGSAPSGTWYRVEIPAHDRRLANVEARIELTDSVLMMYPEGADHLPRGWSTYLRGLSVTTDAGQPVRLRRSGRDRWIVPRPFPRAVRLRYEVLLHHDAGHWPFGSKDAGYVKEDGVFLTGKSLFITQRRIRPTRVTFALPPRWRLATPWAEVPGDSMTFQVPDTPELLQVGMLAGRHQQRRLLLDGATVILAIGQSLPGTMDLFSEALSPALAAASAVFGGTPRGKFVVIANADSYDGGTAFTRSVDVVFRQPPTPDNRAEWSPLVLHELLHLWLGGAINTPAGEQQNWFLEGATDYLANLLALRAGVLTQDQFYDRLASHWDAYRAVDRHLPLYAAGEDKAANDVLVYSGGLLAAFVLDTELRRASEGRVGIEAVMRRLYGEFGRTGVPFTGRDLRRVIAAVHRESIDWLFARHVHGTELLPVEEALARVGRTIARAGADSTKSAIAANPEATAPQRALEQSLLGTSGR